MKLEHVLFILLVAQLGLFGLFAVLPDQPHSTGLPHPDQPAMNLAGDGPTRSEGLLLPAFAFAVLQVSLFTGLLLLGLRRPGQSALSFRPVLVGGALLAAAFVGLFLSYRGFLADPLADPLVFGLPAPTAWMLLGVWWSPIYLVWLYRRHFGSWVFTHSDRKLLEELRDRHAVRAPHPPTHRTEGADA